MVCRNIPQGAADSFETLPEMYLGLGVRRDALTGVSQGATHDVPAQGIDLSVLRNDDARQCLDALIRSNPSLLNNTATALQIIRHFQNTDRADPNHITWGELTRDYEANAEAVAAQLNAYLGLVTFLSQSSAAPVFPAHGPAGGACPNVTPQTLSSYEDLTQAYVGLGVDRHPASGVARRPLPVTPQTGLDLSVLDDSAAVACIENMARNNPSLMQDLHRVQQILQAFRDGDPLNPNTLTLDEIQNLYGDNAGHALVSINAYLGLLRHVGGRATGQDSGVNPWVVGGAVAGAAVLIGGTAYVVLRPRNTGSTPRVEPRPQAVVMPQPQVAAAPPPPPPAPVLEAIHIATPERPLIERLREARTEGGLVEIFMREPNPSGNIKEKYVAHIVSVSGRGDAARIEVRFSNNVSQTFRLDQILTVRDRSGEDLSRPYIHTRLADPQFRDRAVNISGTNGTGMGVLVDYSDPRLTSFLEEFIRPIRERLDRGEMTQRQAADAVRQIVHDQSLYDQRRGGYGGSIPNQLYRLGDFIETGVCNERGMLVQVSLQFVGVESRLEKGPFMMSRHAWVRATVVESGGGRVALILDPQDGGFTPGNGQSYEVGRDALAQIYVDDGTPFAREKVETIVLSGVPATDAPAPIVRTGWEEILTHRVNDTAVFNALERMDTALARYYRENISTSLAPTSSMSDLVQRISLLQPHALDAALRSASLEGHPSPASSNAPSSSSSV